MPYRYFLVFILLISAVYLSWIYQIDGELDPLILILFVSTAVLCFVFQHQINQIWWMWKSPDLDPGEKSWVNQNISYISDLTDIEKSEFYRELSKITLFHEFILMGDVKIAEELKWKILAPAVRLKMYNSPKLYQHYIRTAVYPHPFISPEKEFIHIGEVNKEDGLLIFSAEQILLSILYPNKYMDPALYYWCQIWCFENQIHFSEANQNIHDIISREYTEMDYQSILNWFGEPNLEITTHLLYARLMNKKIFEEHFPEYKQQMDSILKEKGI